MEKIDYLHWLKKWFQDNTGVLIENVSNDFFAEGWLDSFKTLQLITQIEKELDIQLSDAALSDPRFSNLTGLSEILVEEKNRDPIYENE